jgi:hypothetical protein
MVMSLGLRRVRASAGTWMVCMVLGASGFAPACKASAFSAANIDLLGRSSATQGLVAVPAEAGALYWNPAGLGFRHAATGFAGYMDYLAGLSGGTAGYVADSKATGVGVYLKYLSSGPIERTGWADPLGGSGEAFYHGEVVAGVSGGRELAANLAVGGGVKYARQDLDDVTEHGAFADLGSVVIVYPWPAGVERSSFNIYASIVTRNITIARWGSTEGDPPVNSEIGLGLEWPSRRVAIGSSYYMARSDRREVRLGITAGVSEQFEVRAGYRRRTGAMSDAAYGMPWERGLFAGFGVAFGRIWLDYTYEDASPLDSIHRFGLKTSLGPGS